MKRRLLAYMLLAMLLGTGSAVFAQPEFVQQLPGKIEQVQQLVAQKSQNSPSLIKYSEVVDSILMLLAEALLLGGLTLVLVNSLKSYYFSYSQALVQYAPDKEKARRFSWDDVL